VRFGNLVSTSGPFSRIVEGRFTPFLMARCQLTSQEPLLGALPPARVLMGKISAKST
jgi:hypothetical protein